jgi:hypothetical protein
MRIMDQSQAGLGVHQDNNGKPFAEIQAGTDWSITASREMLEMLVDSLGKKLMSDKDIDPASDGHQVQYLVEVGDPVEVFAYQINGVSLWDFITPEFYDLNAAPRTSYDFLNQLQSALEVPAGCYISWLDPQDGRWHQKQADGSFITARLRRTSGGIRAMNATQHSAPRKMRAGAICCRSGAGTTRFRFRGRPPGKAEFASRCGQGRP